MMRILLLFAALFVSAQAFSQTTISGTVTDSGSNDPLIGVNIVIKGTTIGTVTDIDGKYTLTNDKPLPWEVEVSYIGYEPETVNVTAANSSLNVSLIEGLMFGQEVVVSASRKREKVQEAPASVSVISARKLEVSANATDPTRNLISTPGVQIQQQSANRINISMRGGAGLFGTSVFPIMDYRSLVGPGIGTFQSDQAGISNIDLQKIEVVRGPGSALYGPGVTQGVVHFITKNPIDFPGTSVEAVGGSLSTYGLNVRHAGKAENNKFGYKINARYQRGDEFTLDPNDPEDAAVISNFTTTGVFQPGINELGVVDPTLPPIQLLTFDELDDDNDGNPIQSDWNNTSVNATLEFRPKDNLSIFLSGGYNEATAIFNNEQGEGLAQSAEVWTQARVQAGGLFAQLFFVDNNGGTKKKPSFLYRTGNRAPVARTQLEGQVQYNFDTPSLLDGNWTVGLDYRFSGQDTENLVYGRNEDDDDFSVIGGYLQGKFKLADKLDLVLAGRYDRFNFIDEGAFVPRAAMVYKINSAHTLRASYNKASFTVSNLQLNIDFPLSTVIPGSFDVWLYGNKTTQTFGDSPMISWFNGLIPDVPVGTPGLPLAVPHQLVNTDVVAGVSAALSADPATAALVPIVAGVLNGVNPLALGTTGSLGQSYNIFDGSPLAPIDAPVAKVGTTTTLELGYKGLVANKVGVTFDLYHITTRNNDQFTAISPAYTFSGLDELPGDLGTSVSSAIATPLIDALVGAGLPQAQAEGTAAQLLPLIAEAYTGAGDLAINTPDEAFGNASLAQVFAALPFHATVQTEQVPQDGITHLAAGYRIFDKRDFLGADLGLEYYFNQDLSAFFNYSWVSDIEFMQNVVGVEGASLPTYLNIPKNKFRMGMNYTPESGIRGNISFQHDDSYFSASGEFAGVTDERNLIDAAIGYKFENGLAIDLSATNLLNNEYRYLPNMPKIGGRYLGKVTYTFGNK
ncbi:MAG: TonB-dependent receptor domain-containing protein [Chitinophagales bacterium]